MKQKNTTIRRAAMEAGLYLWEVAEGLGLTDFQFSRKLRHELSDSEREHVLSVIEELRRKEGR